MARGARWRERQSWERLRWAVGNVLQAWSTQPISLDKLLDLGTEDGAPSGPEEKTPDEARAFVEEIAREHKKKFWTLIPAEFAPAEDGDKDKS